MPIEKLKKTRAPGVFKNSEGRLVAMATVRDAAGKQLRKRQVQPEGASLTQAAAAVEALKQDLLRPVKEASEIPTLRDYSVQWLKVKAKRLRSSVAREVAFRLATHCLPVKVLGEADLGSLRLDRINRMAVENWVAWSEGARKEDGTPYSADTVAGWWRVLTQCLRDIMADFDLPDPTRRVKAPRIIGVPKVREQKTLDVTSLKKFLGAIEVHQPGRHAEIMFMAYTGCRPGEVFGLHWSDVDLEGTSELSQGTPTADLKYSATDGKLEWVKTNESRPMPLIPKLVEVLSRHRQQQLAGRAPKWHDGEGDVVFPSETKTYRLDQSFQKPFKLCSHAVGQKVTPQVVRRSVNSILVDAGVDPLKIREILGHTTAAMTTRYSNIPIGQKHKALTDVLGE